MAEAAKWYVVHTYSGYENTVKATIEKTVEARQLQDIIHTVSIPMETVTELTDNGPKTYDRKLFPGYVLVKMIMTDDTWHIIKNVRGVTGFITSGSTKPTPLSEDELYQLGVEKREIIVGYAVGDTVSIEDGPFAGFNGVVEMLDIEKNKVRVIVSMFGRETPIELELDQVEAVSE
ncbi:MAG: transcription termination/antitermination factor NusG [Ruminococcaceae bacterium]|nr:transcription termination/antitermination factor NusG [Oscillospiraceae bacterium]